MRMQKCGQNRYINQSKQARRKRCFAIAMAAGAALGCLHTGQVARAASTAWNVDAAGAWSLGTNWTPAPAPGATSGTASTDVATFSKVLTSGRTVDTGRNIGTITFAQNSANAYTLSGGSLFLSNGGLIQTTSADNGTHNDTISTAITLEGSPGTGTFTASGNTTTTLLSVGAVVGTATASNVSNLTLNGTNAGTNSVTGIIGNGSAGGTLAVIKSGTGFWALSGANTYSGGTTFNGGTLQVGSSGALGTTGLLSFAGGTMRYTTANQTDYSSRFSTAASQAINIDTNSQTINFGTAIASSGGTLTKVGSGVLSLSAANSYTAGTSVTAGVLSYRNTSAQPATGVTNVGAAGILALGVGGSGFFASADVDSLFNNTLTNVTLNATAGVGIDTTAGDFTYSTAQSAARSLTKVGANTLILNGANSYTGGTNRCGGAALTSGPTEELRSPEQRPP